MRRPVKKLYGFGFNFGEPGENVLFPRVPLGPGMDENFASSDKSRNRVVEKPRLLACEEGIDILSCSWCDSLVIICPTASYQLPTVWYTGIGLSSSQIYYLRGQIARAHDSQNITVFASPVGHGIQGFLLNTASKSTLHPPSTTISVFIPSSEVKEGQTDSVELTLRPRLRVEHIAMGAEGRTTFITAEEVHGPTESSPHVLREIWTVGNPNQFLNWAKEHQLGADGSTTFITDENVQHTPFEHPLTALISNHTTTTLLTTAGQVYTSSPDPRFPACLGRPCDSGHPPSDALAPLPYFSETRVVKIASGGYMTAAISEDGEFFIWGQAGPGMEGLAVLKGRKNDEEEQDEFVKLVSLSIDGHSARATHVAVGSGHVLVAAEAEVPSTGEISRAVFAAGDAEYGQLGIGLKHKFVNKFVEVPEFRGCKVVGLEAAGWASWAIVETEEEVG